MKDKKVIIIPNLDKHQHYKDKRMVWIKLYVDILQDYKFCQLTDRQKWLYIGLLILAVKNQNCIPLHYPYLNQLCSNSAPFGKHLSRLGGEFGEERCDRNLVKMYKLNLISIKEDNELDSTDKIRTRKDKEEKRDSSSNKELTTAYKEGKRNFKERPFYLGNPMRWSQNKWWVIEDGEWKEFALKEDEIEWK